MASATAATLSWPHSFRGTTNETAKLPEKAKVFKILAQKKARKTRKIILKEDVEALEKEGQPLDVKAGYFRDYLLPMGICSSNREKLGSKIWIKIDVLTREMKMEEERIEAEKKRVKEEAQQLALIFETVGDFKVKRKGGKGKQIFGSVTAQDLVDVIKAQLQRDVDKRIVYLPEIRETGEYIAELKLHPEVTGQVRVNFMLTKDKHLFPILLLNGQLKEASCTSLRVNVVKESMRCLLAFGRHVKFLI